jgi:hypothetical protein
MKLVKHLFLILVFLCALPIAVLAQTISGSVSGVVTDPNGAVVPGATVVATHVPTGRQYTMITSQAGLYVFPNLPTGPYTFTVKQTGFKAYIQTGIEVRVDLRETIDIKLTLGTVQQTVEVKATAPVLETANATRGEGLSPQSMATLPLWNGSLELANGFLAYMAGVTSNGEQSIGGSIGRASEVLIDGASAVNAESGGVSFYFPGFYAFSEMKLISSGFLAEDGRVGGGIQTYVTKSGTNAVHGAAFFNFKRQFLDAVAWSLNQNPAARNIAPCRVAQAMACRPKERFNEEGGYAGGPVYIPHVYDGRNRTFWYFTWAGFWQPAAVVANTGETVPTAAMTQGNFQGVYGATVPKLYDFANLDSSGNRLPFGSAGAYNIIPSTRISTISKNIIPYIPAPNSGVPGVINGNYAYNSKTIVTDKDWSFKIDHSIHTRNRVAFFMTHRSQLSSTDQYLPGPISNGLDSFNAPYYERATDDFVINPHWLLHTLWGFSQERQLWNNPLQNGFGTKFGFPYPQPNSQQNATPYISFAADPDTTGYTAFGMNQGKVNNGGQWNWITTVAQQMTWIHNKHEFKMGWDIRRMRTTGNDWATTNGSYQFKGIETAAASSGALSGTTGSSFASFLLGAVDNASEGALPVFIGQTRYGYHAGFFQDTWRIRPHFTLNLGLRYEVPIGWHNVNGDYSSFSPTVLDPPAGNIPGGVQYMGSGPGRIGALRPYPTDFSDIGPRAGFAWNVRPSIVVRGAWGIFYEGLGNGGCGCEDGFGGGTFGQSSPDSFSPAFNWDPGTANPNKLTNNPGGVQAPASFKPAQQLPGIENGGDANGSMYMMGPKFGKAPRVYSYNLTLQKEYKNWSFEGAYEGERSVGLNSSVYINTLPTSFLYLVNTTYAGSAINLLQSPVTSNAVQCGYYANCTSGATPVLPWSTFASAPTTNTFGWGSAVTLNQALAPFPQYKRVFSANSGDGRNWFDSFQFKVEHRFGNLNLESTYVFEKILNIMSYRQIFTQTTQQGSQDSYNLKADKGLQIEDMPHVINLLMSYRLPVGRGQRWLANTNPIVNHVVGNWTFAMDGQYRSGALVQILNPTNYLSTELFSTLTKITGTGLPIRTGVSTNTLDPNNPNVYFFNHGTAIPFTQTPAGQLGNASYYNNQLRQPWIRSENISLNKQVKIREAVLLNYQVNIFNPFNRTDFGGVNTTITSSAFGRPTAAQLGPRNITMGLRLEF